MKLQSHIVLCQHQFAVGVSSPLFVVSEMVLPQCMLSLYQALLAGSYAISSIRELFPVDVSRSFPLALPQPPTLTQTLQDQRQLLLPNKKQSRHIDHLPPAIVLPSQPTADGTRK